VTVFESEKIPVLNAFLKHLILEIDEKYVP